MSVMKPHLQKTVINSMKTVFIESVLDFNRNDEKCNEQNNITIIMLECNNN